MGAIRRSGRCWHASLAEGFRWDTSSKTAHARYGKFCANRPGVTCIHYGADYVDTSGTLYRLVRRAVTVFGKYGFGPR